MYSVPLQVFVSLWVMIDCDQPGNNRFHWQHSEIIQPEPEPALAIGLTLAKILYILGHMSLPQLNRLPFLYYPQIIHRVAKNHPSMFPRFNNLVNRFKAFLPNRYNYISTQESVTIATTPVPTILSAVKKNVAKNYAKIVIHRRKKKSYIRANNL